MPDWIGALVKLVLALIGGGAAWKRIEQHGELKSEKKQAEANVDALTKQAENRAEPYMAPAVRANRLRRAAARLRALRDREAKP